MSHDNDTIRRIVAEIDKEIRELQIVARIPGMEHEVSLAVDRLKEARFWLKESGDHAGHFDMLMPTGEDE